jgi:polysaccharide biosynthesis protein PslH
MFVKARRVLSPTLSLLRAPTRRAEFEAMAIGKAVVSTTIDAAGLPVHSGKDILIADDPQEFADETVQLLQAPTRRADLGWTARELVARTYSWDAVVQPFETVLNMLEGKEEKIVSS